MPSDASALAPDDRLILESELATLIRLQLHALERAQFVSMTAEETLQFERRGDRINEIIGEIGLFYPECENA